MEITTFSPGELYSEKNIVYAREQGYIVGSTKKTSEYEAAEGFFYSNTRKLHPVGLVILHHTRTNARACILGHGAGGETSQIFGLRPDIHLESFGLSAVDPFYPFKIEKTDPLTPNDSIALEHSINNSTIDELRRNRVKLQSVFQCVQTPYIQRQHCVENINDATIEPQSIDFLYESCGYLYYNAESSQTATVATRLLSNKGIAMLPLTAGVYAHVRSKEFLDSKVNVTLLDRMCILAAEGHQLHTMLSANYNSLPDSKSNRGITFAPIKLCRALYSALRR